MGAAKVKLTEAQRRALELLAKSGGDVHFERKPQRAPAVVLIRLGLAEHRGFCRLGFLARITAAGRAALGLCAPMTYHEPCERCRPDDCTCRPAALTSHDEETAQ